ncbi:MAG: hypothetical protein R2878_10165 [Thermoleophilia bacterium]
MDRRLGQLLLAIVAVLFVVEIAAIATGRVTLAAGAGAGLVVAWFVVRSFARRARERADSSSGGSGLR